MNPVIRAVCAILLLFGLSAPGCAEDPKPLTTIFLAARDELPDPNFKDSIVLVMNNIGPAPAGVIVNRPTRIAVSRLFPEMERLAQVTDKLYFGGPVDLSTVSFVFRAESPPENATQVLDGVYVSTDADLLRTLLERDNPMEGLRIFVGYSSWGPGQLENEIARGDWTLKPAATSALFEHKSEHPWPETETPDSGRRI